MDGIPQEHVMNLVTQYAHDIDACKDGKADLS